MDILSLNGLSALTGLNMAGQDTLNQIQREQAETDSFQAALENAVNKQDDKQLKEACQSFEAYFLHLMFREMRKTIPSEGILFPKSQAELIFQDMLDEETTKSAAAAGGIGLADAMFKQMKRNNPVVEE